MFIMEPNNVSYYPEKDPAAGQLGKFKKANQNSKSKNITTSEGAPVGSFTNVLTAGPRGPMLIEDTVFLDEIAHFNRERIPERVVHAKGAGAFGYFEVTQPEITKYSRAAVFNQVGKRTPVAVRFSVVARERGSADTVRDVRGFAVKLRTEEGNWDLVGNNTPIFFIRDPFLFPRFIHSQKRNPQTNLIDYNARWDYFTLRPESLHQVTWLFSDAGTPDGFRHMNGWGSHTYKLVNSDNQPVYNKFHWRTNQGVKNLDSDTAMRLTATDPDYAVHDLFDAIARKDYPSWTLYVQIMTYDQARKWEFNPFDLTKIWPEDEFPLIEVGRMTLNRNPVNYFAEVEQLAFSPANRVRGIEFSPDKVLQSRIFAYNDTQRHRIGPNYFLIPVNQPIAPIKYPTIRDGNMMTSANEGNIPNYYPNSFDNVHDDPGNYNEIRSHIPTTDVDRFVSEDEDNYTQVRDLYLGFSVDERERLHNNVVSELQYTYDFIQQRALGHFEKIHSDYANGVRRALQTAKSNKN